MRCYLKLLLIVLFFSILLGCKQEPVAVNFKDMVIAKDKIWAIDQAGKLRVFSATKGDELDLPTHADTSILTITKDTANNVYLADARRVYELDTATGQKVIYGNLNVQPWRIVTCNNTVYNISDSGITDIMNNKTYLPDSTFNISNYSWNSHDPASVVFVDQDHNIWVGFSYGEFGGGLFAFSTSQNKFIKLQKSKNWDGCGPIRSLVNVHNSIYATFGLDHMMPMGSVDKLDNLKWSNVFTSMNEYETTTHNGHTIRTNKSLFIGPSAYNRSNDCFYFYTPSGIFRGKIGTDLSKISNWKKVIALELKQGNGRSYAVGPAMNVTKMEFDDRGTLFFLSVADGIGMYDVNN